MNLLDILTPLYLLISLGFILKRYNFPNTEFWPGIERISYFILFPTLIFVALMKATIDFSLLSTILLTILVPTFISGALQWLGFLSPNLTPQTFSSMFQGSIRNNTMISLVVIAWVVPDTGLALMALIILIMVPANNFLSVLALLRFGSPSIKKRKSKWWLSIVGNPLIIACFFGLLLNTLDIELPSTIIDTADFLGRSALPFALLAVGASLKLKSIFHNKSIILLTSFSKLIIMPLACFGLCEILQVNAEVTKSTIIFCAMPTAVSSFILAKQMGGNSDVMAQIITFQTLMAAVTLPLFLLLVQNY